MRYHYVHITHIANINSINLTQSNYGKTSPLIQTISLKPNKKDFFDIIYK
jgi:hypothetical protein